MSTANPLSDGVSKNLTPTNPVNEPDSVNQTSMNTFSLRGVKALTARFADITPFMSRAVVTKDNFRFSSSHELRSYTMSAPLMSPLRFTKSYYFVPQKTILPYTWDKIFVNPKFGEDIPSTAKPVISPTKLVESVLTFGSDCLSDVNNIVKENCTFRILALCLNLFSHGSLLKYLGYSLPRKCYRDKQIDLAFLHLVTAWKTHATSPIICKFQTKIGTETRDLEEVIIDSNLTLSTLRHLFSLFECGYDMYIPLTDDLWEDLVDFWSECDFVGISSEDDPVLHDWNLSKVLAYQLVCAQYFTNDDVDNVSSSSLYMDNMHSIAEAITLYHLGSGSQFFTQNGIKVHYDFISNKLFDTILSYLKANAILTYDSLHSIDFLLNLFTFKRSLRFGDYFNGSRTRPLAVGDVNIAVTGGYVSVIDVTKNIVRQRFLNFVNRMRSGIAQYTKGLFGVIPKEVDSMPQFLAKSDSIVGSSETTNTGDAQSSPSENLTTQVLRSQNGQYEYEMFFSDYGVVLGLCHFDCIGCYDNVTDRANLYSDRYEYFNPMLENVGDQQVYGQELDADLSNWVFSYQQRYGELKNEVNSCVGGFSSGALPSWLFIPRLSSPYLTPSFLRFDRVEFDKFYSSLTGASMADYFHFIIVFNNDLSANRPMQYQSRIL